MIVNLAFDLFALILLASAVMVISSRNPVHSVLFLILAFINAAALFLIAGAEFLAMILVIVYVGAVAVLFLFVVMMLDVNFAALREGVQRYAPIGAVVGFVIFVELALVGSLIYTKYLFLFQLAGMVLLVSMIGAIVLTLRDRKRAKTQNLDTQHSRLKSETLSLVSAKLGAGATVPSQPEDAL
jgi:NADH-quinone oxidoreductase subunit J